MAGVPCYGQADFEQPSITHVFFDNSELCQQRHHRHDRRSDGGAGTALTGYQLWALLNFDTRIYLKGHSVVYNNSATNHLWVALPYVIATCGALFFSGYRYIVGLGAVNLVGIIGVLYFKQYAFTSVWCAYAAPVSVLIYGHFHRRRAAEARGEALQH